MVGTQFENISGDGVADMNQIIKMSGVKACLYEDVDTLGAEIMVRVGEGYKFYYFINDAYDADDNEVAGDVWADMDGYVVDSDDLLALGDGFWFHARGAAVESGATITVAGQVASATEITKDLDGATAGIYSIIANPFPVGTDLGKVVTSGLSAVLYEDVDASGNTIMVREGEGYKFYYYINDAYDADDNEVVGDVWTDMDGYIVDADDVIAPGKSFWILARQNGSITFSITK